MSRLRQSDSLDARIATDPEMQRIDRELQTCGAANERRMLRAYLGGTALIVGADGTVLPVPAPTPGVFGLLELYDSPLLRHPDAEHALAALYVCLRGRGCEAQDARDLGVRARHWFGASAPASDFAADLVWRLLGEAIAPYRQLPPSGDGTPESDDAAVHFGCNWLAGLVARVSGVTRLTPDEIVWQTPMQQCAFYDLEYRRLILHQQGIKPRGNEPELLNRWFRRLAELEVS